MKNQDRMTGLSDCWHTEEVQTEAEIYERIQLQVGEKVLLTGAFSRQGRVYFPSFAMKESEDVLSLHYLELSGEIRKAEIRKNSSDIFSDALTLAWRK